MATGTNKPVGSTDPRDLVANAANLDAAVNGDSRTFTDRFGRTRVSMKGVEEAVPDAMAARDGAYSAKIGADAARFAAELARDATFASGDVYSTVEAGLAAVATGGQFQVVSVNGQESIRYRKDSATTFTEMARFPLVGTPQKSLFMRLTRNLFDGVYYPFRLSGNFPGTGVLYNDTPLARTAIFPVISGKTYSVAVLDSQLRDVFRIAVHTSKFPAFNQAGAVSLTQFIVTNDTGFRRQFVSPVTGFAFVYVSATGKEPRIQCEEGSAYTDYVNGFELLPQYVPESVTEAAEGSADFLKSITTGTRNLFNGAYLPYAVAGVPGSTAFLRHLDENSRTAVAPIVAGQKYYIKVHDPARADAFRVCTHTSVPPLAFGELVNLTETLVTNSALKEYSFTANITGFVFVTVSGSQQEPRLQIEGGDVATPYVPGTVIAPEFIGDDDAGGGGTASEALALAQSYSERTRNLFDQKFLPYAVRGTPGMAGLLTNYAEGNRRCAYAPITEGKTYSVKIHEPALANQFRIGVNSTLPELELEQTVGMSLMLAFNDILKEYTFTASITGYVFVTVSDQSKEPLVQIEEGLAPTEYVPYLVIKPDLVKGAVDSNAKLAAADAKADMSMLRHDCNMIFPCAVHVEMEPTDPGPRFVEYFDGRMWGFNFLTRDICYSENDGDSWTVYTNIQASIAGAMNRLLPTEDGEVLLMTSSGVHKSLGWTGGNPTWSASKVTPHANGVLFQFAFDGDGTKFIVAEYASTPANWVDSRFVWISTDAGETFDVVWDSLEQHGELTNSQTHLHAVCYDRFSGRFYIAEGHGPKGGIYCSTDDGATWAQPPGYRDGPMASENVWPQPGDTNGPTVMVATPTGLVMGSDHKNNGMFGLPRKANFWEEKVVRTYDADRYGSGVQGVKMFAIRGRLDETSGAAYVTFRSEHSSVPPIICAGTAAEANLVYEHPNLPVIGGSDQFGAIAKTSEDRLVAYAQFNGSPYTLRGDLVYPASAIQSIIRVELKKLGLIS